MSQQRTVVWRIVDDKAGHLNQSKGLVSALAELVTVEMFDIPAPSRSQGAYWWATGRFPPGNGLPRPDLIVGAGHKTHLPLLAARRAGGGKVILLGKPTLPAACFDLCLTPVSDEMSARKNVILTWGVLNIVHPSNRKDPNHGLLLIGGPSGSHGWDTNALLEQITEVVANQPQLNWLLTTSRRTPPEFVLQVKSLQSRNLTVVSHEQTDSSWLPEKLAESSQVWVTEDSVSMIYEALTSGAAVGVLAMPCKRVGRVTRGMIQLRREKWVTAFEDWDRTSPPRLPPRQIDESRRAARIVVEKCLAATPLTGAV